MFKAMKKFNYQNSGSQKALPNFFASECCPRIEEVDVPIKKDNSPPPQPDKDR